MRDNPEIPTLREIAAEIGVSPMTVSRALRQNALHRSATQKRIYRIATRMGYRPNPLVSALMSQRVRQHGSRASANLALLDPRSPDPEANSPYFRGCIQQATALGYQIETFPYQPDVVSPARLREILMARGIRGIVLGPVPKARSEVDFDFTGFAAATIGYSVASPVLPRVASDIQNSMYEALSYLEGRGYRRVGLIMADDANRRMLCLYSGASSTYDRFFAHEMKIEELMLPDEQFDPKQIRQILRWIKSHRLQAVLSSAEYLYARLLKGGAAIPRNFAYLHLHKGDSHITSMDQMREVIGRKAVDLISAMIQRNETCPVKYPQTVLMPSTLHEGPTVPDLSQANRKSNGARQLKI